MTQAKSGGNKESSTRLDGGEDNKCIPEESIGTSAIGKPRTPRKGPAGGRTRARARKMTVVDVALAAVQKKREAKLKARDMLKTARGLVLKGRWNR